MDLFIHVPFQLPREDTALLPLGASSISVLPDTHLYLSEVKHVKVKCLVQGYNIETTMSQLW